MRLYQMADAVRYEMMNTEELRETFLLEGLFEPGEIEFAYVDLDRTVIGSAVPDERGVDSWRPSRSCARSIFLSGASLAFSMWVARGRSSSMARASSMEKLDCLYVGRGSRSVTFCEQELQPIPLTFIC